LQGDFIGREALLRQKANGVKQMLGIFKLEIPENEDVFPWGNELIYRNGSYTGYVTSAGYGFSVGGPVCMGYVSSADGGNVNTQYLKEGKYEIQIDGKRYDAELTTKSFYDPNSVKMKI
jgi:4-methylaminobutanoate oxidase (formaldehyde-forming)